MNFMTLYIKYNDNYYKRFRMLIKKRAATLFEKY